MSEESILDLIAREKAMDDAFRVYDGVMDDPRQGHHDALRAAVGVGIDAGLSTNRGAVDLLREARPFLESRHTASGKRATPRGLLDRLDQLVGGSNG